MSTSQVVIGHSESGSVGINLRMANRHGFVAGATGTGKTVTLHTLAEQFSRVGVPVFLADIKGDLTGMVEATSRGPGNPVRLWDLYSKNGQPIRIRVAQMGPELISRLIDASVSQEGIVLIAFHVARDMGMHLDTLGDLEDIFRYMTTESDYITQEYGKCDPKSIGVLLRKILMLKQDADVMFGSTCFKLQDLMEVRDGAGVISLLDATHLIENANLYSTFLLWLLSELFRQLPEVGDVDKPKMVFFFDEAHLLFSDAPKSLLSMIERVVRLIRSKGVGIYFVTQKPNDIPDSVLAQLSNRVQHALRAYTANEQKGLRSAAQSFRANPDIIIAETIQNLQVGEALVSTLDTTGVPQMVQKVKVQLPTSKVGPATNLVVPKAHKIKKPFRLWPKKQYKSVRVVTPTQNRIHKNAIVVKPKKIIRRIGNMKRHGLWSFFMN